MAEMIQTTLDAPTDILSQTLLTRGKREAFGERITLLCDSLLSTCLYSTGNQTTGSPMEHPIQTAFKGETQPGCFAEWIDRMIEINEGFFGRLGQVEPEQVLSAEAVDVPKEIRAFADRLRTVAGVESLSARRTERGFETWVLVNRAPRDVLYAIYEVEWDLMAAFPGIPFDFHVIDRRDRQPWSVATFDEHTITIRLAEHQHVQ